jgi:hypothetical protein
MPAVHLALFADDTCVHATEKHERRVLNKFQRGLTPLRSWWQRWNIKINEGKTQAIYFSRRRRMPRDCLQLNGRNIPYVNSVKYLGVIFDRRMTWRPHIEKTAAKVLWTYIRTYSIFKSKHLNANIKLIVYGALIRSPGSLRPTLIWWNFNSCRTDFSALLANLTGAHQSLICIWRSKFRTCTITQQNYAGDRQKLS